MGVKRKFYYMQEQRMVKVRYVDGQVIHRTMEYTVRLAYPVTKIRLPPGIPHASSAKPGSRCEARTY